jgi:hypothetical protein
MTQYRAALTTRPETDATLVAIPSFATRCNTMMNVVRRHYGKGRAPAGPWRLNPSRPSLFALLRAMNALREPDRVNISIALQMSRGLQKHVYVHLDSVSDLYQYTRTSDAMILGVASFDEASVVADAPRGANGEPA